MCVYIPEPSFDTLKSAQNQKTLISQKALQKHKKCSSWCFMFRFSGIFWVFLHCSGSQRFLLQHTLTRSHYGKVSLDMLHFRYNLPTELTWAQNQCSWNQIDVNTCKRAPHLQICFLQLQYMLFSHHHAPTQSALWLQQPLAASKDAHRWQKTLFTIWILLTHNLWGIISTISVHFLNCAPIARYCAPIARNCAPIAGWNFGKKV